MKSLALALAFVTTAASAEVQVVRVLDDAKTIDRVAEMSKGELPRDILSRIIAADIDLLRGRHPDDTYDYARYERLEATRSTESFSVRPTDPDRLTRIEKKGSFTYRVIVSTPSRRLVVAKNRPLFIDRVEIEYMPQGTAAAKTQIVQLARSFEPGTTRTIEIDDIARQATVRVFARAEKESGSGNVQVTLVQARIFDNPDSPYADPVSSAKSLSRALDQDDLPTVRTMAQRMISALSAPAPPAAPPADIPTVVSADADILPELHAIEDLLTGSDTERRRGADRLHQLIRKLRIR